MRALVTEFDEHLLVEAAQRDRRHFAQLYEHNFDRIYADGAGCSHSAAHEMDCDWR